MYRLVGFFIRQSNLSPSCFAFRYTFRCVVSLNLGEDFWNCPADCFLVAKVPLDDLVDDSKLLIAALSLRWDYCKAAQHSFPSTAARFLRTYHNQRHGSAHSDPERSLYSMIEPVHDEKRTVEGNKE